MKRSMRWFRDSDLAALRCDRVTWGVVAMAAMFFLAVSAPAQEGPTLVSDKEDYMPGEIAVLTGAGFQPFEVVDISLSIDDPEIGLHVADYTWSIEQADADGGFETYFEVPWEAAGMTLTATAIGCSSGLVASATFTDRVDYANITSPTTASPVTITSLPQTVTVTFQYATSGGGTAQAEIAVPGVVVSGPSNPKSIPPGGTPAAPLTESITITIPAGTANGSYNVQLTITDTGAGTPKVRNDNEQRAISVNVVSVPTNSPPTLSGSNYNAGEVGAGVPQTFTVTPSNFAPVVSDPDGDPVSVTFSDGTVSKEVTFYFGVGDPPAPPVTLTLKATDEPSARNVPGYPPLTPMSVTFDVQVSYTVHDSPPQTAPTITASDLDLGDIGIETGTDYTRSVSVADFNVATSDAEGDPVSVSLDVSEVTLTLPEGMSDLAVSAPVVITATDDPSGRNDPLCPPNTPLSNSVTVYVNATLHRNHAPTLSASDLNLGQIVGCLVGGSMQTTVSFAPEDFNPVTGDPDGDPVVSITADIASATLVGPGRAEADVVLTATDDPSVRTNGTCAAKSTSIIVKVKAQVVYNFLGFGPPLASTTQMATRAVKRGSDVPTKFQLFDCSGTAITTGVHTIAVYYVSPAGPDAAPVDLGCAGSSNTDNLFRYSAPNWIYNLKTNTSYQVNCTYKIVATLDDGTTHEAYISIKR